MQAPAGGQAGRDACHRGCACYPWAGSGRRPAGRADPPTPFCVTCLPAGRARPWPPARPGRPKFSHHPTCASAASCRAGRGSSQTGSWPGAPCAPKCWPAPAATCWCAQGSGPRPDAAPQACKPENVFGRLAGTNRTRVKRGCVVLLRARCWRCGRARSLCSADLAPKGSWPAEAGRQGGPARCPFGGSGVVGGCQQPGHGRPAAPRSIGAALPTHCGAIAGPAAGRRGIAGAKTARVYPQPRRRSWAEAGPTVTEGQGRRGGTPSAHTAPCSMWHGGCPPPPPQQCVHPADGET